ncbi:hypothetical protein B0I35DRAFT_475349 [Stachybotrys elegans]|uniref:C2H2-type domain-containing protein n=1 Tax=Stachybotrys elegans TaxID=80388 RepID=A0A8K0WW02_9HYPO|nr:hypothetical protein B0I35DRAFT_475349 [Stachybotrys elegans]
MDQQAQATRPRSASYQQSHINQSRAPPSGPYPADDPSGLGLGLEHHQQQQHQFPNTPSNPTFNPLANNTSATPDYNLNLAHNHHSPNQGGFMSQPQHQQPQQQGYAQGNVSDPNVFDPSASFGSASSAAGPDGMGYSAQNQSNYLSPNMSEPDFSLFPNGSGSDFNTPLFEQTTLNPNDINNMTSPQMHHSPTPPHLLPIDPHQPGSAQHSPSFNQHQFSSPPGHGRHASLGPEAALMPNQMSQMGDWTQPQFQGHRRSPSDYSDVSSVAHSPNLPTSDSFDADQAGGHSPLQRASDGSLYQEVLNMGTFTISDHSSPGHQGRSPSHSPAISPRIPPQSMPEVGQPGFVLNNEYGVPAGYPSMQGNEAFPTLGSNGPDMTQVPPPSINIDLAPNAMTGFESNKSPMDQDALTPPERGRQRSRQRAVTDPFHAGHGSFTRSSPSPSLSPSIGSDYDARSDASRSLSPLDRQAASSPSRRRQSTSAVPNNIIALRLADPEYQGSQDSGPNKRVQKHPATFQCTLCPKRFTRAYNLRSHLRTHTDERPFVCTVCGKAFARQHDRKRHESLHSGEKKFVCKGDLQAGGQWGCGRRFARADALGRHFRSEAGRICIKPLLDEEAIERQRQWQEQRMQQNMVQNMAPQGMNMESGPAYDPNAAYGLPAALLAQYPALAQMNWSTTDMNAGMDDEISGRSSFDASDYDEGEEAGYVSGPGTGFGEGGMNQNYGEMGYASDFGGR